MGLVKTFLQIAVTLSLAVFISTPSVAAITPAATCADYSTIQRKKCNAVAGCQVPEGDNHCQQCEQGYYCPAKEDVTHKAGTPCPTAYPNSDLGSGAISDCYSLSYTKGNEYNKPNNTVISCNADLKSGDTYGYCPYDVKFYNNGTTYGDGWGRRDCISDISGADGRTVKALTGLMNLPIVMLFVRMYPLRMGTSNNIINMQKPPLVVRVRSLPVIIKL